MYRLYYCPNCRATIYSGDRFCGNCGVSLKWIEAQIPPANANVSQRKSVDSQNLYRQHQDEYHKKQQAKPVQHPYTRLTQKPVSASPKKQTANNNNRQTAVLNKNKPADDNTELLKNEVAKLLENFLDKAE